MRFFSTFAVAISVVLLGSALPASAQRGVAYYGPDGVHCYGGYVSTGTRCVYAGNRGGGYYAGYGRRQYRGDYYGGYQAPYYGGYQAPGGYYSYDGAHCYGGAYSTGDQCVVPIR